MKNNHIITGLIVIAFALFFQGCGASKSILRGTEKLVETGGKKPTLLDSGEAYEVVGDKMRFIGESGQAHDRDVALRVAEITARRHIVERIAQDIRVEGIMGLAGQQVEAVGRFLEESTAWLSRNVRVSGAVLKQKYWEKHERFQDDSVEYFYEGYALVEISKADYRQTKAGAVDRLIDKAIQEKNEAAEQAARVTKERLLGPEEVRRNVQ